MGSTRWWRVSGWQAVALATAGGIGALALANRLSAAGAGTAHSVLAGETGHFRWAQRDVYYVVKGRGVALVLIHGVYAGASSFEYRRVFDELARAHRVYAMDLLGFGLSDRPPVVYTPDLYVHLIEDFVRQVMGGADHPVRVVASTLSAAFVIRAADAHPQLFERLVLVEPTGIEDLAADPNEPTHAAQRWLLRTSLVGQGIYNAMSSRAGIRHFLRLTYGGTREVSDDLVDYYYTMAHQRGARFAPASFLAGALDTPVHDAYPRLQQPILLIWGKNARFTPLEHARAFRLANPRADLRVFDTGALPQDQNPGEFAREVMVWLQAGSQSPSH